MIEEELLSDLTPDEKKPRLEAVLERIREVEVTESHVKYILIDNEKPDSPRGIHFAADICRGYSSVVLYGISTEICLPFTEQRLRTAGFQVQYDQRGVIE
jgi:hypothetical protein